MTERPGAPFDPEPYRGELRGYLARRGLAADADDLIQETFARALRHPPASGARAWLVRIAQNLVRDRARRGATRDAARRHVALDASDATGDPARAAELRELAQRALAAARALPGKQRQALLMRLHDGLDYSEIARRIDCTEGTARQHVHLGLKAVRDALPEVLHD